MAIQIQCSNCRGFKVESAAIRIDPVTGKEVSSMGLGDGCALSAVLYIAFALLVALLVAVVFPSAFGASSPGQVYPQPEGLLVQISLLSFLVLPIVIPIIVAVNINKKYAQAVPVIKHYCTQCGKKWNEIA